MVKPSQLRRRIKLKVTLPPTSSYCIPLFQRQMKSEEWNFEKKGRNIIPIVEKAKLPLLRKEDRILRRGRNL
ncbi:hypothetical protein CEXT_123371 [Caerostris extrusa]|uniref:Uncharacterized protein n=1 Tax=Caerostris extrusa TaxID=172846 RepID=A0AAV4MRR1_CAEEX|nr:hypothetical protein CEXT_123371 [Caerostris extrusa]